MIIIRLIGGLGNQMFQYSLGRRLALERRQPLKVDLSWFVSQSKREYQLCHFCITAQIASPEEVLHIKKPSWARFPNRIHQAIQRRLPYYRRAVVYEKTSAFDPHILRVRNNVYLMGYWQTEKYSAPIRQVIQDEFRLMRPLSMESQEWAEKIRSCNAVSIHIRRGDYVNDPKTNQVHGILPRAYYMQATAYLLERVPKPVFFVFSDDMPWARQNLGLLSSPEFVGIEGEDRDVEELILMTLCKHHIIANSSYSWWGAWLGRESEKIVIAAKQWFGDLSRDTGDLIPEAWIRM